VELLILILGVGIILGYCILHPIKSIKFLFVLTCVMILGTIGVMVLFTIPWLLLQI